MGGCVREVEELAVAAEEVVDSQGAAELGDGLGDLRPPVLGDALLEVVEEGVAVGEVLDEVVEGLRAGEGGGGGCC